MVNDAQITRERAIKAEREVERLKDDLKKVIEENTTLMKKLQSNLQADILDLRDVETPCKTCGGLGVRTYGDTSTWRHRMGGQTIVTDVCDMCWGSGDQNKKWVNLRRLMVNKITTEELQIQRDNAERKLNEIKELAIKHCMDDVLYIINESED